MATAPRISVEEYLHSFEWEPDADYVDGEIEERPMGEKKHAKWQVAIVYWFRLHANEWHLSPYSELRVQVSTTNFLVPDVLVLGDNAPDEETITHPPIAVFEVLSPEDRIQRTMRKLGKFAAMGIGEIWVIDPDTALWTRFEDGQLLRRELFSLPERGIEFSVAEIGKLLL